MAEVNTGRNEVLLGRCATTIQTQFRSFVARKNFTLLRHSAMQLQSVCRGELARRQVIESLRMRRETASCLIIQSYVRMLLARKSYKDLSSASVSIQTAMRGMAAHKELLFRRQTKAAILIQSHCRELLAHLEYKRKAAITIQSAVRGSLGRKQVQNLQRMKGFEELPFSLAPGDGDPPTEIEELPIDSPRQASPPASGTRDTDVEAQPIPIQLQDDVDWSRREIIVPRVLAIYYLCGLVALYSIVIFKDVNASYGAYGPNDPDVRHLKFDTIGCATAMLGFALICLLFWGIAPK